MTDPLLYLFALLTLLGAPGPTNTLLATAGASLGLRRTWPLLLVELAAYLAATAIILLLLGPIITAYPLVGSGLKLTVAIYLVWVAIALWKRPAGGATAGRVTPAMVLVTTLLNPKAIIVALSLLPAGHPQIGWYFAGFAACIVVTGAAWIALGRAIGAGAGRHAGLLPRIAAVVLGGFAGVLVVSALG